MCYCNNADGTLGKSISDAETKIPQVESAIKEDAAMKKQLEADLKAAQENRVEAKDAIAKATSIRDKESKAFDKVKSDAEANIGALSKAIPAIEKGLSHFSSIVFWVRPIISLNCFSFFCRCGEGGAGGGGGAKDRFGSFKI